MSPGYQAGTGHPRRAGRHGGTWRARGPVRGDRLGAVRTRPPTGSIPDAPGSYQFLDAEGRVLYVGKAKSLRHRLANYWQDPGSLPNRTAQMIALADRVEWVVVRTEVEALILEHSLIQAHKPRFNVRLKDDKSYPWLAVTVADQWPRPAVVRGRKRKGVRYFGPYGHVRALRDTLDLLVRSFPVRTCSDAKLRRHQQLGSPCLLFHIDRCSGPCIQAVGEAQYQEMVRDLMRFLSGDTAPVVRELQAAMEAAADGLEFERAARLRDRLAAVRKAAESQQMVSERPEDFDVLGIAEDEIEAAVHVFHVRRGRVVGSNGFIADKVEDLSASRMTGRILEDLYGSPDADIPRRVLVPRAPDADEQPILEAWLAARRGGAVHLQVPLRGAKRSLQETVTRNAAEDLTRHRLRRASDHNARARALLEIQEALGLPEAPLRIECFDMSHLQGSDYVGSMVVFEDGVPKKSDYRRFVVKSVPGNDDYAAMGEVLERRLRALDDPDPHDGRRRRFAYTPQLLLLDGGLGQLGVGVRVLGALGLTGRVSLAALAKQFEEVFVPGRTGPVRIPRGSEALYLLQRIRDEAHRFAITHHRTRRGNRMTASALDAVRGLGPTRRTRLLAEVGGMRALRDASLEELMARSWLPDDVALGVFQALHGPAPSTDRLTQPPRAVSRALAP